ncbi:hypothetical protein CPB97_009595 [Podila verticillata]|nr:hypothetical protein CPB97_009595 [Podila verticillata]
MVPFYAVSNQEEEGQKAYSRSYNVAEKIQLGDAAMRLSTQEKLSAKDVEIRNAWRSLVWLETIANLTLLRSGPIELSKDLAGASLVPRPEEVPTSKTSIADTFAYHLCNLMKLFQSISKIKLPMSPRDVHAVTSILDSFGAWHSALPKSLRAHSSKGVSSSKSPFSPHAAILDLYYRLGQILLLNNLPQSTRSSPTGLGPRRESPLRTLATCANGITATIGDLLKSADLKNYCLSHGVRCLTEAATIQMANTRESDPSISTPAKVNLMKTLWCIRQINFGLPADKLSAILDSFDASKATAPEADIESRDIRVSLSRRSVSSRPRTSSISAMSLDSPQLSTMSLAKRATSQTSDQDFAASDGSMLEGLARARSQLASPTHDISASSLLSLSLESPSAARRSLPLAGLAGLQVEPLDREAPYRVREYLLSRRDQILEGGQEQDEDIKLSGRDSRLADRSRSSSFSVFSPRTESSTSSMVSMSEVQSSRPTFQPVTTQAWEAAEFVQPSPSHEYPPLTPYSDPLPSEENMSQKYGVVFGTRDPKYQEERKGPINPPPLPPGRTTLEYDDTVQSLLTSRYGQPQWRPPFSPTDPSLRRSSTTIPHPGALMSSLQDRDHIPSKSVTDVQGAYPVRQDLAPTSRPGPSEYPVSRSQAYFDMSHNVKQGEPHTSPPHTSWSTHPLEAKQLQRTMSGSRPHGPRDDTFHAHDSNFTPPVVSSTFQGSSSTGRFRPPSRQGSQRTRASSLTMAQRTGPPGPSRALDTSRFGVPEPDSSRFGAPEQLMHPSRRGSTRHHPLDGPEDMLTSPAAVRPYVDTHRASASRSLPIDIGSVALTSDPSESVVGGRKSDPAIPGYPSQDTSGHPIASAHGFGFSMGSRGRKRPSLSMYGGDNQELSVSGFTSGVGDRGRSGSNVELMNHGTRHLQRQQHDPHMTQPILSPDEEQFRHAQPRLYDQYQQQRREMQQRELQLHLLRLQQEQPGSSMATSSTMQTPQYTPSPYPSYDPMELHPSIYAPNYYEHPANYPRQTPQQQSAYPPSYPSQQQQHLHQLPPQQLRPDQGPVRPDRGDEALADVPRDPIRRKYR